MAQRGRNSLRIDLVGFDRNDPAMRALRSGFTLKRRVSELNKIVKHSGEPMLRKMKRGSPVDTGALRNSLGIEKARRKKGPFLISYFVGARTGRYISGGEIKARAGWRLHWAELGTVKHPGRYFMGPAIRYGMPVSKRLIRNGLRNLLRNAAKRLGRGKLGSIIKV